LFYIPAGEEIDLATFTKSDRPTRKEWERLCIRRREGVCEEDSMSVSADQKKLLTIPNQRAIQITMLLYIYTQ